MANLLWGLFEMLATVAVEFLDWSKLRGNEKNDTNKGSPDEVV